MPRSRPRQARPAATPSEPYEPRSTIFPLASPLRAQEGFAPLHQAAYYNRIGAARALIEGGADLNAQDRDGWTPLIAAASRGLVDMVRLLLESGADPLVQADVRANAPLPPLLPRASPRLCCAAWDALRAQHPISVGTKRNGIIWALASAPHISALLGSPASPA